MTDTPELTRKVRMIMELRHAGIGDARVLGAIEKTPRELFVPDEFQDQAYENVALPIANGQTISQPYIVALMTEAVAPAQSDRCLEIGTGSGYQAAVLAELCAKVFSIEYIPELAAQAEKNLRGAGYGPERVQLFTGDGYRGWPEEAPFQVIVVTAAPPDVPMPLRDQLAVEGRMVVPVGPSSGVQELELWKRTRSGRGEDAFEIRPLADVRFVPFLGSRGAR